MCSLFYIKWERCSQVSIQIFWIRRNPELVKMNVFFEIFCFKKPFKCTTVINNRSPFIYYGSFFNRNFSCRLVEKILFCTRDVICYSIATVAAFAWQVNFAIPRPQTVKSFIQFPKILQQLFMFLNALQVWVNNCMWIDIFNAKTIISNHYC